MRSLLLVTLLSLLAGPIAAQTPAAPGTAAPLNPLTFIQAGEWPQAQYAASQLGDPLAVKLVEYFRMLAPNAASAAEIAAFAKQNPDWPLAALFERRRQEALAADTDDADVAALCAEREPASPTPARGAAMLRCAEAFADLGRGAEAAAIAREAWVDAIADPASEAAFVTRFPGLITPAEQWTRFQRLAWNDPAAARRQIAWLDPAHIPLANARLALLAGIPGPIASPAADPGAMLDLARAYRKLNQDAAAVALWRASGAAAQQAAPDHLVAFWVERQALARQLLRDHDPGDAYAVVAAHGQVEPGVVVEAEFLAGFIALRELNDPGLALGHFTALAAASPAVLTQSRAYYWLGRAQAALGHDPTPDYARAAGYPTTFYGQLAARAGGEADAALIQALRVGPTPAPTMPNAPVDTELARAARILVGWGDPRGARPFLFQLDQLAHTPEQRIAVGDYATAMDLPDIAVIVTRQLGRDGIMPPMQGWPVPYQPPAVPDPAFSLGIMRQESNFDIGIVSSSGARGLMQLMPGTARLVAHRLGEPTSDYLLTTDPAHNIRVGAAYLQEMLDKFANSMPLAAAAYNAGPNRVSQWLAENGDPRTGTPDMIDWIERIPYNETRNYVERVLENVVVYQARLTGTLPAAMPSWSR